MSITVKLSAYEQALNNLNKLPLEQDRIFTAALRELKVQRDQLQERLDELKIAVAAEARCTNEQMLELRFDVSNARARQYELQDEVDRLNEYVDELTAERNAAEAKNSKYRECLETIHYSFKMGNVVSGPMLDTWAEFIEKALNNDD